MAEEKTLQAYLERAYELGKEFANNTVEVSAASFNKSASVYEKV